MAVRGVAVYHGEIDPNKTIWKVHPPISGNDFIRLDRSSGTYYTCCGCKPDGTGVYSWCENYYGGSAKVVTIATGFRGSDDPPFATRIPDWAGFLSEKLGYIGIIPA